MNFREKGSIEATLESIEGGRIKTKYLICNMILSIRIFQSLKWLRLDTLWWELTWYLSCGNMFTWLWILLGATSDPFAMAWFAQCLRLMFSIFPLSLFLQILKLGKNTCKSSRPSSFRCCSRSYLPKSQSQRPEGSTYLAPSVDYPMISLKWRFQETWISLRRIAHLSRADYGSWCLNCRKTGISQLKKHRLF